MKKYKLFYNGKIYTQAGDGQVVDSIVIQGNNIIAVGKHLEKDEMFNSAVRINLRGRTVLPGFTDSHTHFRFHAIMTANVRLDGLTSLEATLNKIKKHSDKLAKNEWVLGDGFAIDRWRKRILPDKYMLDKVTGGRPAAIYSKDQHILWVNSEALKRAKISRKTSAPIGGVIDRFEDREPYGILRELPGYEPILKIIADPPVLKIKRLYKKTLKEAYAKGVTAIHSMDGPKAYPLYKELSKNGTIGLRVNYYPPPSLIPKLRRVGVNSGYNREYLHISGIKLFADGSLGSQTALCFNKYKASKNSYGVETNSKKEMLKIIKNAASINLPCTIHAIGDKAVSNVIDCFEKAPKIKNPNLHRIEHLQMIRRIDINRLKKLKIVASMQPSHCPSDIKMMETYWGKRGRNCFVFRTLLDKKIPLVFGSDVPIEPIDPISGIAAAVNRTSPDVKKPFYPEQRISVKEAVAGFTSTPPSIVGRGFEIGRLLPGFKADFIVLSENIYKTARTKIKDIKVLGTYFDGKLVYKSKSLKAKL
ncbi:MAG: amidohydrolase [candidate division Zixibacteria bacterium]|nr:amidohydrolase [candidate division Zixibacteria bacterium]